MNADTFAEWMRRQGHRVYRTESSYWYDAGMRVLQAFPYHWVIQPSEQELNRLMLTHGILSLRYSTPVHAKEGVSSYHIVQCSPYNLEGLRSQARNGIKRGLENSTVERISFERLAEEGWKLQCDTLERQGRKDCMAQADWQKICLAAKGLAGFEAWGAMVDGELAASIITTRIGDMCYVPYAQSQTRFMSKHVNNALFYTACRDMLARSGVTGIFFTVQSLDAPASIDEFKLRMGFKPVAIRQRVVFNPLLEPFATESSHRLVTSLLKRRPGSYILSKAEGMLRFHIMGRKPLEEQPWPECIEGLKQELLHQELIQQPLPPQEIPQPLPRTGSVAEQPLNPSAYPANDAVQSHS